MSELNLQNLSYMTVGLEILELNANSSHLRQVTNIKQPKIAASNQHSSLPAATTDLDRVLNMPQIQRSAPMMSYILCVLN